MERLVRERLDVFMARANAAYYATHDPFADFTTSPEISQAFGEILGLWAAVTWTQLGRPTPVLLAEAGPGRGTLMADALRAIRRAAPDFATALRLHLIEFSPRLRAEQRTRLPEATWHDRPEDLPDGPLLLLANEFLDALPIRQFVRRGTAWRERWVGAAGFEERETPDVPPHTAPPPDAAIAERCDAALTLAAWLGTRLSSRGGAALFLDYGPAETGFGDSLQAIAAGRPADPLGPAGSADLTAHVDFAAFAACARRHGAVTFGPEAQGRFLARLGLFQRTNRLARRLPPTQARALLQATQRLAEPNWMGRLFKALVIASPGAALPAGFELGPAG